MYVLSLLFAKQNVRVCVSVVAFIVISFLSLSAVDVGLVEKVQSGAERKSKQVGASRLD